MITVDFKRIPIADGDRILDIGCGTGRHVCAAYAYPSVFVVGADLDRDDLHAAAERLAYHKAVGAHQGGTWALASADATRMPFANASFHVVICSEVLEHIIDHRRAVAELWRVLRPGGRLVVSVPRYLPEWFCWKLSDDYHLCNDGHVRIYRKAELIEMISTHGAVFNGHHYAHSLHSPYWWLKCLIGPTRENALPVRAYHRFLVWDMMKKPAFTNAAARMLDPVIGKSLVLYFTKPE